jgi:hypothetical protein
LEEAGRQSQKEKESGERGVRESEKEKQKEKESGGIEIHGLSRLLAARGIEVESPERNEVERGLGT